MREVIRKLGDLIETAVVYTILFILLVLDLTVCRIFGCYDIDEYDC